MGLVGPGQARIKGGAKGATAPGLAVMRALILGSSIVLIIGPALMAI